MIQNYLIPVKKGKTKINKIAAIYVMMLHMFHHVIPGVSVTVVYQCSQVSLKPL